MQGLTKFYIANPERPIITVKATINGKGPFNFVLDTGASMTIIERQTAEKLGLLDKVLATRDAQGAGGTLTCARILNVESIKVDDTEAKEIQVGVLDLSNLSKLDFIEELAGIIGYNFMKDYRVIIDYPKQEIFFKKDDPRTRPDLPAGNEGSGEALGNQM